MIDASEDEVSRRIERGGVVIYGLKAIFAHKNRTTCEAKLKSLAKRVLNAVLGKRVLKNVLRIYVGRGKVLNALKRVARYRAKSQEPLVSKGKNIDRIEIGRAHILRPDIGGEIRFVLVTTVNARVEGKTARKVMREGHSNVSGSIVLARHVEILAKASHTYHKKLCPFPRTSVSENDVFSDKR